MKFLHLRLELSLLIASLALTTLQYKDVFKKLRFFNCIKYLDDFCKKRFFMAISIFWMKYINRNII